LTRAHVYVTYIGLEWVDACRKEFTFTNDEVGVESRWTTSRSLNLEHEDDVETLSKRLVGGTCSSPYDDGAEKRLNVAGRGVSYGPCQSRLQGAGMHADIGRQAMNSL
ncbi:hypothetical protein THAOC_09777, partial [Thalassiosira oceanica]